MSARQDDVGPSGNTWLGKNLTDRLDRCIDSLNLVLQLSKVKQLAFFRVSPHRSLCVKQLAAVLGNHLLKAEAVVTLPLKADEASSFNFA